MNRNQIISEVYESGWLNEAIGKMHPEDLQEDLKHEVILVLLEMQEDKLFEIHEKGFLKFFAIRTMLNMIKSDRSKFFMMFRNFTEMSEADKADVLYQEPEDTCCVCAFENTRDQLYEKDMLWHYTYTYDKNALALSRGTGIPYKTVTRTLINAKQRVKCYLQSQLQ